jgi:hypothetical protein
LKPIFASCFLCAARRSSPWTSAPTTSTGPDA